jgi:hypothetical protein
MPGAGASSPLQQLRESMPDTDLPQTMRKRLGHTVRPRWRPQKVQRKWSRVLLWHRHRPRTHRGGETETQDNKVHVRSSVRGRRLCKGTVYEAKSLQNMSSEPTILVYRDYAEYTTNGMIFSYIVLSAIVLSIVFYCYAFDTPRDTEQRVIHQRISTN